MIRKISNKFSGKRKKTKQIVLYELACISCGGIKANVKKFIEF